MFPVAASAALTSNGDGDSEVKLDLGPVRRNLLKVGRHEPCACGIGTKYKNCCGRTA